MATTQNERVQKELPLADNEFTSTELFEYLYAAYRYKINGATFTHTDLYMWIQAGCLPQAYGGNKIIGERMSGIRIVTIEGLSRETYRYIKKLEPVTIKSSSQATQKRYKPLRTKLYYQLSKQQIPDRLLPDNWMHVGIRRDQLSPRKKK